MGTVCGPAATEVVWSAIGSKYGGSFTETTVTVTAAVATPPCPSLTVYVKPSLPLKSGLGVYVTRLPSLTTPP